MLRLRLKMDLIYAENAVEEKAAARQEVFVAVVFVVKMERPEQTAA